LRLTLGKGEQAISRIPRRQHAKLLSQSPRASTIIRYGDDPGQRFRIAFTLFRRELRESLEHRREPRAATQRDDAVWSLDIKPLDRLKACAHTSRMPWAARWLLSDGVCHFLSTIATDVPGKNRSAGVKRVNWQTVDELKS